MLKKRSITARKFYVCKKCLRVKIYKMCGFVDDKILYFYSVLENYNIRLTETCIVA